MLSDILNIVIQFFITGLLAFGGGMATLPFLYDMSEKFGWFTGDDVLHMLAVSESTPGPIGVNMATYVGFTVLSSYGIGYAIFGGIIATLALVLPSIIVILIISSLLNKFRNSPLVDGVFTAIRPASLALIASAGIGVMISTLLIIPENFSLSSITSINAFLSLFNFKGIILAAALFVAMRFFKKLHPIVFILISAVIGIIFSM